MGVILQTLREGSLSGGKEMNENTGDLDGKAPRGKLLVLDTNSRTLALHPTGIDNHTHKLSSPQMGEFILLFLLSRFMGSLGGKLHIW